MRFSHRNRKNHYKRWNKRWKGDKWDGWGCWDYMKRLRNCKMFRMNLKQSRYQLSFPPLQGQQSLCHPRWRHSWKQAACLQSMDMAMPVKQDIHGVKAFLAAPPFKAKQSHSTAGQFRIDSMNAEPVYNFRLYLPWCPTFQTVGSGSPPQFQPSLTTWHSEVSEVLYCQKSPECLCSTASTDQSVFGHRKVEHLGRWRFGIGQAGRSAGTNLPRLHKTASLPKEIRFWYDRNKSSGRNKYTTYTPTASLLSYEPIAGSVDMRPYQRGNEVNGVQKWQKHEKKKTSRIIK